MATRPRPNIDEYYAAYGIDPQSGEYYEPGTEEQQGMGAYDPNSLLAPALIAGSLYGGGEAAPAAAPAVANAGADVLSGLAPATEYTLDAPSSLMYGGEELFPGGLGGEASSLFSLDSGGLLADGAALPIGNYIPGAVGSYLAYDTLTNPDASEFHNAGQGALAGAGIGFTAGGPVGAGIGAAVGGIGGLARGLMDHTSPREKERKREQSMYGQGIAGYDYFRDRTDSERDAARGAADSSSPDFVGKDPRTGLWVNNKYGKGGYNERDLRPEDIWGTPDFFEHYGNDWLGKFSEEERRQKAQQALDSGAVRSKDGGIRVDFGKIGQNQQAVPSDREGGRNVAVTPSPKAPTGTNPTGGPVRLSPGVYKDPRTGKVFLSKTGRQ